MWGTKAGATGPDWEEPLPWEDEGLRDGLADGWDVPAPSSASGWDGEKGESSHSSPTEGVGGRRGRVRRICNRLGLRDGQKVAVACACIVLLVVACAIWGATRSGGVVVSRAEEQSSGAASSTEDPSASGSQKQSAPGKGGAADGSGDASQNDEHPATVTVHVDGAVANPGVYQLQGQSPRVIEAVQAAGGLLQSADTSAVNLAAPLEDGAKVHVPLQGEDTSSTQGSASTGATGSATGSGSSGGTTTSGSAGSSSDGTVNINTATAEQLTALPGVGEATARAIVEDRQKNGRFTSPEDLMRVSGIGQKKFDKMKDKVRV